MKATRAERLTALWTSEGPVSTPWGVLSWRQVRELAQTWDEVSWRITSLRDNPACADEEHAEGGRQRDHQ